MRILFTNLQLNHRTGTEAVVRDMALGMRRRGHQVAVYTPHPGGIASELAGEGVCVFDRIDQAPFIPDVVHGHHHSPTIEALARFDDVPAIWVCHDRFQYEDIPPRHPSIGRYVAVDLNCRERLVAEAGIPEDQVVVIHNSVDLERIQRRCELPDVIGRAAVFSNNAKPGGFLDVIAQACGRLSIPLDVIGEGVGAGSDNPEQLLGSYDLVFAKARCALEALAAGCAVLLIDFAGLGQVVTTENVATLREWNFGARCLQATPTPERIIAELEKFDSADAGRVTDLVRKVADLERSLDRYVELYEAVIARACTVPPPPKESAAETDLRYTGLLEQRLRHLQVPLLSVALPPTIAAEIHLRVSGPQPRVLPETTFGVEVTVSNGSKETLASVAPFPVHLSYHWICPDDRSRDDFHGLRTTLVQPLYPGASVKVRMRVESPDRPGRYLLRVTLVQESVFWFDELAPPVGCWLTVEVLDSSTTAQQEPRTLTLTAVAAAGASELGDHVQVVRDGIFADLGFVDDRGEQMMVFADSELFVRRAVKKPSATCIVTTIELVDLIPSDRGVLTAPDPKEAFFRIHNWIADNTALYADDRATVLSETALVHPTAWIDPLAVVIGDGCVIGPNVVIHGPAELGPRTKVDAGTVIGSTAFQTSNRSGHYVELQHVGGVSIGADCHVYSNASIARGVFRARTEIGDRCQIGNGAFVSHQCRLGHNVFVGHNATINGRVEVGEDVWIGPGSVIANELTIGVGARIALGSIVMQDVPPNKRVSGLPAVDQQAMFRHAATIKGNGR